LLLKLAIIQPHDLHVCKFLLFFMDVMIDCPKPKISLDKLGQIFQMIIDML
jgi:hypothetical protein